MLEKRTRALDEHLSKRILDCWQLTCNGQTNLPFLDQLVTSYTQHVPWESVFRIAKKEQIRKEASNSNGIDLSACPRWPQEFWEDSLLFGGGGTCFESNYAFFSLLLALGYEGYLTINNMGESVGCHAAIVIKLDGQSWLVDVGMPLYMPLPINPEEPTGRSSAFHHYTIWPVGDGYYQIERDRHPQTNCYTLIDQAIPEREYREITTADYDSEGRFLDRVIITKVIDSEVWRFCNTKRPYRVERFSFRGRREDKIENELTATLANKFKMDEGIIRTALETVTPF